MKKFKYRAKKGAGQTVSGQIQAETREAAVDKILEMGLIPVDLEEDLPHGKGGAGLLSGLYAPRVKGTEVLYFYRQLSKLVKSGIPLLAALGFSMEQTAGSALRQILSQVQTRVRDGQTLSSALAVHPQAFSRFDIAMIQMGEAVGKLEESLARIAAYRKAQEELRKKVRNSLIYPAFIALAGLGTVFFLLVAVVPQFSYFFSDLGQELPFATRLLIRVSGWLQAGGGWFFLVFFAGLVAVIKRKKSPSEKAVADRILLKIPGVAPLVIKSELARMARTLELLIRSGVPVLEAVRIAGPVAGNDVFRRKLQACTENVEQGGALSEAMRREGLFPAFVYRLIHIGEESGRLEESMAEIAEWYEQETEEWARILTQLLEPAVILIIGAVLGAVITAVMLPIFSMNAMIQ